MVKSYFRFISRFAKSLLSVTTGLISLISVFIDSFELVKGHSTPKYGCSVVSQFSEIKTCEVDANIIDFSRFSYFDVSFADNHVLDLFHQYRNRLFSTCKAPFYTENFMFLPWIGVFRDRNCRNVLLVSSLLSIFNNLISSIKSPIEQFVSAKD